MELRWREEEQSPSPEHVQWPSGCSCRPNHTPHHRPNTNFGAACTHAHAPPHGTLAGHTAVSESWRESQVWFHIQRNTLCGSCKYLARESDCGELSARCHCAKPLPPRAVPSRQGCAPPTSPPTHLRALPLSVAAAALSTVLSTSPHPVPVR